MIYGKRERNGKQPKMGFGDECGPVGGWKSFRNSGCRGVFARDHRIDYMNGRVEGGFGAKSGLGRNRLEQTPLRHKCLWGEGRLLSSVACRKE